MKKIAFCFLIIDEINHEDLWYKYFSNVDPNKYTIYIHYKSDTPLKHFEKYKLKNCIETSVGDISIVHAQNLLLEEALKDRQNEHFIFLSESCIPLKHFDYTYAYLNPKYSYFSIGPKEQCFPRSDHALSYVDKKYIQKSYQCILNVNHALLMTKTLDYLDWFISFPDEHCYITKLYAHALDNELVLSNWDGELKNYDIISEDELTQLSKNHLFGRKFNKECDLSKLHWTSPFHHFFWVTLIIFCIFLLSVILFTCIHYKWNKRIRLKLTPG